MRVYAFVGPSGTGKSYRAQMVAGENNISYIIDDGLLVNENAEVAGFMDYEEFKEYMLQFVK